MPERVYTNRIPGQERIHIELTPQEIHHVLSDFVLRPNASADTMALLRVLVDAKTCFEPGAAPATPPVAAGRRGRLRHNPGAGALRAAAHSCAADCDQGLSEADCATAHPIQISGWHDDVVANVWGPVEAIAAAVLHGALPSPCEATAEGIAYGPLGPCILDQDHAGPIHLGPQGERWLREGTEARPDSEIVHACPPDGSGVTPCCNLTPFELPRTQRMTTDATEVTCQGQTDTGCGSTVEDAYGAVRCARPYGHEAHRRGYLCWDNDGQWYARRDVARDAAAASEPRTPPAQDTREPR
jgi:hypothetical protein